MYSLREAARAVGRGKPTILKAIKAGRLSAEKDALGQWRINPAELHRVYPPVPEPASEPVAGERQEPQPKTSAMQRQIKMLQETVADLRGERDRLLQVIERQTLLLQDQRPRRWRWRPFK